MRMHKLHPTPKKQQGVALAVALILLAVIGLSSVTAMQSGLFGSMISNNLRTNALAVQSAEMGLRFCERGVRLDPDNVLWQPLPAINTDRPTQWNAIGSWGGGAAIALDVPAAVVDSSNSTVRYSRVPQCLVERMELQKQKGAIDEVAFLITARGFSPDYREDGNGTRTSGSVAWLQSIFRWTP